MLSAIKSLENLEGGAFCELDSAGVKFRTMMCDILIILWKRARIELERICTVGVHCELFRVHIILQRCGFINMTRRDLVC